MKDPIKRKLPLLLVCLFVFLSSAGLQCQPTAQTKIVDLNGLVLLFGFAPNTLQGKQYTLYAGNPTKSISLTMDLSHLSSSCPLKIVSGDGSIVETITSNGRISTSAVPGNIISVRADCINATPTPSVTLISMALEQQGAVFPEITRSPANMVSSYPLTLNSPVELIFPPGGNMTYFFTLDNVMGKQLDYVLDSSQGGGGGIADAFISDDVIGFVAGRENAIEAVENGFGSILFPERNTLLLTVKNRAGRSGSVRFSVNELKDAISLRLKFMVDPALIPSNVLPDTVRDIWQNPEAEIRRKANAASQILYLASEGRIRIEGITAYADSEEDIRVYPFPTGELSRRVPAFNDLQRDRIILGYEFLDPSANALPMAQEILRVRYGMSYEGDSCPNSIMGGNFMMGLCWDGNHNPFNRQQIRRESMWKILSDRLGTENPLKSPAHIIFNVSDVTFPLSYTSMR